MNTLKPILISSLLLGGPVIAGPEEVVVMLNLNIPDLNGLAMKGKRAAEKDIFDNKLYGYYLPQFWADKNGDVRSAVLKKYHIYGKMIFCVVSAESEAYDNAYDEAVKKEIAQRYGNDFWDRVEKEIDAEVLKRSKKRKK